MSAGRSFAVAFAMLALPLGGCARLVVIDPDLVAAQNSPDWIVHREPGTLAPAPPVAAAPPAPPVAASPSAPAQAKATTPTSQAAESDDDDDE